MLNTSLRKQNYTGDAEIFRNDQKKISTIGQIACFKLDNIENNSLNVFEKKDKSIDENNELIQPEASWEKIDYDAIKYKKSINSSKYKTEFLQFYKDGVLIKVPGFKKINYLEVHFQDELFMDKENRLKNCFFNQLFRTWGAKIIDRNKEGTLYGYGPQCFYGESFFKEWQNKEYKDYLYIHIEGFNKLLKFNLNVFEKYQEIKDILLNPKHTNNQDFICGLERNFYLKKLHDVSWVMRGGNEQCNNDKTLKISCCIKFLEDFKRILSDTRVQLLSATHPDEKKLFPKEILENLEEWQKDTTKAFDVLSKIFYGIKKYENLNEIIEDKENPTLSLINESIAKLFLRTITYYVNNDDEKGISIQDRQKELFNILQEYSKLPLEDIEHLFFPFLKFDSYQNQGFDIELSTDEVLITHFYYFFKHLGRAVFLGFKVNNGDQLPCGTSIVSEKMTVTDSFLYWAHLPDVLLIHSKYLEGNQCPLVFQDDKCLNSLEDNERLNVRDIDQSGVIAVPPISKNEEEKVNIILKEALDNECGQFPYENWIEMSSNEKYQMNSAQSDVLKGVRIIETEHLMYIFLYDEEERFILEILSKDSKKFVGYIFKKDNFLIKNFSEEQYRNFLTNKAREIYTFLSNVIRDFKVTTNRDVVLGPVRHRVPSGIKTNKKRIIYLPRIKYNYIERKKAIDDELKLIKRQPSGGFRNHHVRKLPETYKPSPLQIVLARKQKIEIPFGHTYVRGSKWGKKPMSNDEIIYRSRSMTNTIYFSEDVVCKAEEIVNKSWAGFEEHCRSKLSSLDWDTTKVRVKDGGIDIEAYKNVVKGENEKVIRLFVQCKHHKKNTGPDVIRGILGSKEVEDNDHETQLMVMISGKFSSGAITLAKEKNVMLIDGSELLK